MIGRGAIILARCAVLPLVAVTVSACPAYHPQEATVAPQVVVYKRWEAKKAPVSVSVVDERPSTFVGRRMTGNATIGAEIKLEDVVPTVEQRAREGLAVNDFVPLDASAAADRALRIEIRAIEMENTRTFFGNYYNPNAAFKAVARNKAEVFEKIYRAEFPRRAWNINTDAANNKLLSEVVAKVLGEMMNDPELVIFLAR